MNRLFVLLALFTGCTQGAVPLSEDLGTADPQVCDPSLVGSWLLTKYDPPKQGVTLVDPPAQTYTFDASCTWTLTATGNDYTMTYPSTFFDTDAGHASCAELDTYAADLAGTCVTSDGNCNCTYAAAGLDLNGTWLTSNGQIELDQPTVGIRQAYDEGASTLTLFTRFGSYGTGGIFTRQ